MITERELAGYKRQIDNLKSEVDQAKGTLTQLEAQEQKEVEVLAKYNTTPEEGQAKLESLDREAQDALKRFLELFPQLA